MKIFALLTLITPLLAAGRMMNGTTPTISSLLNSTDAISRLKHVLMMQPKVLEAVSGMTNITILAPSNEALKKFMSEDRYAPLRTSNETIAAILTYHILNGTYKTNQLTKKAIFLPTMLGDVPMYRNLSGDPQVVEGIRENDSVMFYSGSNMMSKVSMGDVAFQGGVAHIIDSILVPPMNISTTAVMCNLTSLIGALTKVSAVDTADRMSKVTVFAPSNMAFRSIGNLLERISDKDLTNVLAYHIVPDVLGYSSRLQNNMKIKTAQGKELTIRIDDDDFYVNGAKVVMADVLTNNGVVHVIDGVLNPDDAADMPDMEAETQAPAFPSATAVSSDPFVSMVPTGTAPKPSGTMTSSATGKVFNWAVAGAALVCAAMMA